jgi:tyrosine-specific transport protein
MKNPVLLASLSLVGTIVGAGIFGIPYVFAQSGSGLSLIYIAILGSSALLIHHLYAQVAVSTPGKHRLVGYVRKHLGSRFAEIVSVTNPMSMMGSILAYIILGGGFLTALFGGSPFVWSIVFFALMSLLILLPFRKIQFFEAGLAWLLIAAAIGIVAAAAPHIEIRNLTAFGTGRWFLPYGVVFFSLTGASVIPDLVECLGKDMKKISRAIVIGTLTAAVITASFGLAVVGVSGLATAENAIVGLVPFVGRYIIAAGAVFGLLAIATSFLTIGENLKEQFHFDFKMSLAASWMAAVGIPLLAFLSGARSLIGVLGFVGAVFGVIDGSIIALMARKVLSAVRPKGWRVLRAITIPLIVVFALGILSEIIPLFR